MAHRIVALQTIAIYLAILMACCSHVGIFLRAVAIIVSPASSWGMVSVAVVAVAFFGVGWLLFMALVIFRVPQHWYVHWGSDSCEVGKGGEGGSDEGTEEAMQAFEKNDEGADGGGGGGRGGCAAV